MKKVWSLACLFLALAHSAISQKVGIGTTNPLKLLHLSAESDSNLLLLENRASLGPDTRTSLYFRNANWYTGAIKVIGQSVNAARMAFFTFADPDYTQLRERMTILDNGRLGVNTSTPSVAFEVVGAGRFSAISQAQGALVGINTGMSYPSPGVRGGGEFMGVLGDASNGNGIGVMGLVLNGGGPPTFVNGSGVVGYSNNGHGVFGRSTRSGYAGVLGSAYGNGAVGGIFDWGGADGFSNTFALQTIGPVKLSGIGEAANAVLTSDALGNATWKIPAGRQSFAARLVNNQDITSGVDFVLGALTEYHDDGNIFVNNDDKFVVPETGVYHIGMCLNVSQSSVTSTVFANAGISINGIEPATVQRVLSIWPAIGATSATGSLVYQRTILLNKDDVIRFRGRVTGTGTFSIVGGSGLNSTLVEVFRIR